MQNNGLPTLPNANHRLEMKPAECERENIVPKEEIKQEEEHPPQEIDIVINNVVCSFSVRCHLNLRQIALNGTNVEYRRENGVGNFIMIFREFLTIFADGYNETAKPVHNSFRVVFWENNLHWCDE